MIRPLLFLVAILFVSVSAFAGEEDVSLEKVGRIWIATENMTFDLAAGALVQINQFAGDVTISGEDRADIQLTIVFRSAPDLDQAVVQSRYDELRPSITAFNNELKIEGSEKITSCSSTQCRFKLILHTPKSLDIEAEVFCGDVKIERIDGDCHLSAASGDVELRGTQGRLYLSTSGGDMTINEHKGFQNLSSSGGDIHIHESDGLINASSSGSDIELHRIGGRLTIKAAGGDVSLEEIEAVRLKAESFGGSIELLNVNIEECAILTACGGDITTTSTIGLIEFATNGGGISVENHKGDIYAKGNAGDVTMRNILGSVYVDLSAGTLFASMNESAGTEFAWDITVNSGDAVLRIPESAKVNLDARVIYGGGSDSISSIFPLETLKRGQTITATGEINGGGADIQIRVGGGIIQIKKN